MGNSTTFLTIPAAQRLGTQVVYAEREIDFTKEAVAASGTIDVLNLPKGAVILSAGWITKVVNTGTLGSKAALSVNTASLAVVSAAVLGDANSMTRTSLTASKVLTADDTLRLTASVSALDAAKIVVFCEYAVSDACR